MYEEHIDKVIKSAKRILGNNINTIIEIGARDCVETLIFNKNFPKSKIYTFECNPNTLPTCRKNVSGISNIQLIESAVSDTDGNITFNQIDSSKTITERSDGNPGASSIFKANKEYPLESYVQKEITVPSTRLDTFFKKNNITETDILWMDIQGAELMSMKSLGGLIHAIKIIHLEFEFFEIYKGQPLFRDINSFLKQNGFNLIELTTVGKYAGDGIYARKNLKRGYLPYFLLKFIFRLKRKIRTILKK
jgi:FkbM family methyltransferase